jgi:hypothetical protein
VLLRATPKRKTGSCSDHRILAMIAEPVRLGYAVTRQSPCVGPARPSPQSTASTRPTLGEGLMVTAIEHDSSMAATCVGAG